MSTPKHTSPNLLQGSLLYAITFSVISYLFWDHSLLYPVKLFVVLLHEISHGLMAIITGGEIEKITVSLNQGGLCTTRGGNAFLIASAGYLGSLAFGTLFIEVGHRAKRLGPWLFFLGLGLLLLNLFYVRSWVGLGIGIPFALLLLLFSQSRRIPKLILRIALVSLGTATSAYAIYDIVDDLLLRNTGKSDASAIAEQIFVPAPIVGLVWFLIALITIGFQLRRMFIADMKSFGKKSESIINALP